MTIINAEAVSIESQPIALITGAKKIEAKILVTKRRGEQFTADVQQVGLSVINHIDLHGDITLAIALFEAMPRGARKNALIDWVCAHGKLTKNEDKETRKERPYLYDKKKVTNLDGARLVLWCDMKKPKVEVEMFDLVGELAKLLKKAEKMNKDGVAIKGRDMLDQLASLAMQHRNDDAKQAVGILELIESTDTVESAE